MTQRPRVGRCGLPRLLHHLAEKARPLRLRRTALTLVGHVLADETFDDSALYDAAHHHLLRPRKKRAVAGGVGRVARGADASGGWLRAGAVVAALRVGVPAAPPPRSWTPSPGAGCAPTGPLRGCVVAVAGRRRGPKKCATSHSFFLFAGCPGCRAEPSRGPRAGPLRCRGPRLRQHAQDPVDGQEDRVRSGTELLSNLVYGGLFMRRLCCR